MIRFVTTESSARKATLRKWLALSVLFITLPTLCIVESLFAEVPTPFTVSIAPTACSVKGCTISMSQDNPWTFYVILTNVSATPQTVWEVGNSWGYKVISFELGTSDGQKHIVSQMPQLFGKNTPRAYVVAPGDQKVYEIRLDRNWAVDKALPKGTQISITLRARYDATPNSESRRLNIWIGHAESKVYKVALRRW